ncbi:unnamed protein product, partial [Anisakis simplex]|uniref:Fibronectin type-III domain-containing protein n=1 Tax=Anisakis simplex TaxID=6269 RepID=A0A0M3JHE3_ANISI
MSSIHFYDVGRLIDEKDNHQRKLINKQSVSMDNRINVLTETHPSAPENVTVVDIGEDWVKVEWAEPSANAHLVQSFSLFIRKDDRDAKIIEVQNVTSPHIEYGLETDTEYTLFVQSHGAAGDSLMSTAQVFLTQPLQTSICTHGQPLFHPNGN